MSDFLKGYSIQHWLESCPQGYLEGTEYGHGADEREPELIVEDPVLREQALKRDPLRRVLVDAGIVREEARGGRADAGEQRRAGRTAYRRLCEVGPEDRSAAGECIDRGRARLLVLVGAELGPEVVDEDDQEAQRPLTSPGRPCRRRHQACKHDQGQSAGKRQGFRPGWARYL